MRHGVAIERDEWSQADALRPLTPEGKRKTRAVCRGLKTLTHVDFLASSPLTRAVQTANIAREVLGLNPEIAIWPALETAELTPLLEHLREISAANTAASTFPAASTCSALLVGHEPHLSEFMARVVFDAARDEAMNFKKSGVCCLEIVFAPRSFRAQMQWFLPPKPLRMLGKPSASTCRRF